MMISNKDKIRILRHSARVLLSNRQYERDFIIRELAKLSLVMGTDKSGVGSQVLQIIDYVETTKERIAQDRAKEVEHQRGDNSIPSELMLDMSDLLDDTLQM